MPDFTEMITISEFRGTSHIRPQQNATYLHRTDTERSGFVATYGYTGNPGEGDPVVFAKHVTLCGTWLTTGVFTDGKSEEDLKLYQCPTCTRRYKYLAMKKLWEKNPRSGDTRGYSLSVPQ